MPDLSDRHLLFCVEGSPLRRERRSGHSALTRVSDLAVIDLVGNRLQGVRRAR